MYIVHSSNKTNLMYYFTYYKELSNSSYMFIRNSENDNQGMPFLLYRSLKYRGDYCLHENF